MLYGIPGDERKIRMEIPDQGRDGGVGEPLNQVLLDDVSPA